MISAVNKVPLAYWRMTGYTKAELDAFCAEQDNDFMVAMVTFRKNDPVHVSISKKTWDRQEGHYGTIVEFFSKVSESELGKTLEGSVVIWLEDGNFDYTRAKNRTIPLLAFGRSKDDTYTILMPDPSFVGSKGYRKELEEIEEIDTVPFAEKQRPIFWRGAATGTAIHTEAWDKCARGVLTCKSREIGDESILDAKLTKINHLPKPQQEYLKKQGVVGEYLEFSKFLSYAYLVDADGYHCAWRSLLLKLAAHSVTLKMDSPWEQWYHQDIFPWIHYVPLMHDLSDVVEVHRWLESHPEECRQIIANANKFVSELTLENEIENVAELCSQVLAFGKSAS